MPKEDYLLKYLEKLNRVLAAMLGFREKGFPDDALRLADETFKELVNLDVDGILRMPLPSYLDVIQQANYSATYLDVIANLSLQTAKAFQEKGNETDAQIFYSKTLYVFYLLNDKDKTFSFERELIISELKQLTNFSEK